jgi:2-iminoacetate synthase
MAMIEKELEKITNPIVKQKASDYIHDIAKGARDFRF